MTPLLRLWVHYWITYPVRDSLPTGSNESFATYRLLHHIDPIFGFFNGDYFTAEALRCNPVIALAILPLECLIWKLTALLGRGM